MTKCIAQQRANTSNICGIYNRLIFLAQNIYIVWNWFGEIEVDEFGAQGSGLMIEVLRGQIRWIGNGLRDEVVDEDSKAKARHDDSAYETLSIWEMKPSCKDRRHVL